MSSYNMNLYFPKPEGPSSNKKIETDIFTHSAKFAVTKSLGVDTYFQKLNN